MPFNYREIEGLDGVWDPDKIPLEVRMITDEELRGILSTIHDGTKILDLMTEGVPYTQPKHYADEFHHPDPPRIDPSETWTLALMTSLRETGKSIQKGRIRRMLRSALPLTSDVSITLNDEVLDPTKVEIEPATRWILGRDLGITEVDLDGVDPSSELQSAVVKEFDDGQHPYITIDGIDGKISGQATLYKSRISGGKSEEFGASNGFFINILGRVINLEQPDFGLENLSLGAWAQFRATVRADGLDSELGVERDGLRDSRQVRIFKRFLMSTFNKARTALKQARMAEWPKAGDILDGSWKTIPMKPLADVVSERLSSNRGLPGSIHSDGDGDLNEIESQWNEVLAISPGDLISAVKSEALGTQLPFSQYKLQTREFVVNESHPYFAGHNSTIEERRVMQDIALADFLAELYLISNDVDSVALDEGREFRDEILRLLAQLERQTGPEIAQMLLESTSNATALEVIVGDALSYIGFNVRVLGGSGEPEGIAQAPLSPYDNPPKGPYSFTYDAKSTSQRSGRVTNQHVGAGTLARHRDEHNAQYALVIAPEFEKGALQKECKANHVTPMRAEDLAKLLMLSAVSGTVDFIDFRLVFEIHDPDDVHNWVHEFVDQSKERPHISVADLLEAFEDIGIEGPDELATSVLADRIRLKFNSRNFPSEAQVRSAVEGLGVFLPSIVRNSGKQVYLSANPRDIRNALLQQLQRLPTSIRMGMDLEL